MYQRSLVTISLPEEKTLTLNRNINQIWEFKGALSEEGGASGLQLL